MPRFVVLRHETPPGAPRPTHWDLMFECGASLRTWAVLELPTSTTSVAAQRLADHRLAYLDYEGPVSRSRGVVSRWDGGDYEITYECPDQWSVQLRGKRWTGQLSLRLQDEQVALWTAHFVPD